MCSGRGNLSLQCYKILAFMWQYPVREPFKLLFGDHLLHLCLSMHSLNKLKGSKIKCHNLQEFTSYIFEGIDRYR